MIINFYQRTKFRFNYRLPYLLFHLLLISVLFISTTFPAETHKQNNNIWGNDSTIVQQYGQLRIDGTKIIDKNGNPVSLRGMSFFWSQWMGKYYNYNCVKWLRDNFHCTVLRAAMGIESGGYLQYPDAEMNKIKTVIQACIDLGIYVIVDWHDDEAQIHLPESIDFFQKIATLYGNNPNIIYEIYNEPKQVSWTNVVMPYAKSVINSIRAIDPNNIIVVGTPTWSQDVDTASRNPLQYSNIAYALHFYAATHKQFLRNKATTAINNGIALFVTEWGTCESTGDGILDYNEVENWMSFMESKKLSWCNWSIADKLETSAALKPNASSNGGWPDASLTPSGTLVRGKIRMYNDTTTSVNENEGRPLNFELQQNYPNPFNPCTTINYSLAKNGHVKINVFNATGSKVATIVNEYKPAGNYSVQFNGSNLASGLYLYRLESGNYSAAKKFILMK